MYNHYRQQKCWGPEIIPYSPLGNVILHSNPRLTRQSSDCLGNLRICWIPRLLRRKIYSVRTMLSWYPLHGSIPIASKLQFAAEEYQYWYKFFGVFHQSVLISYWCIQCSSQFPTPTNRKKLWFFKRQVNQLADFASKFRSATDLLHSYLDVRHKVHWLAPRGATFKAVYQARTQHSEKGGGGYMPYTYYSTYAQNTATGEDKHMYSSKLSVGICS